MFLRHASYFIACSLLLAASSLGGAQEISPTPKEQEPLKVYTEEVLLPVAAYDSFGRFDPSVSPEDILVLEDRMPQQVRSVRRLPAKILVVLDMGSLLTATRSSKLVYEVVLKSIQTLGPGDEIAIVQNSGRVELLQDWTTDRSLAVRALRTKFYPGNRSRLSECLMVAADKLKGKPAGNSHVIIFTDGMEVQGRQGNHSEVIKEEALQTLIASQPSVHVFSFATLVQQAVDYRNQPLSMGTDGHLLSIDTDNEMRRWFRDYARATQQGEHRLSLLAQETGGRLFRPASAKEFLEMAEGVTHDIGAQYVVAYRPQRPFFDAVVAERRRVEVLSRRVGLRVLVLRNQVVLTGPPGRFAQ
jgi:VWFA-related protein